MANTIKTAKILGISRMRAGTDGNGLTTLVGFMLCPLQCRYCLNDYCHDSEYGMEVTEYELLALVEIDDIYFRMSKGGITFGGGEPLMNSEFIRNFINIAPRQWHFRIETSLYSSWESIAKLLPCINAWIIDIKDFNPSIYKNYTGKDISIMRKNLTKLCSNVSLDKVHIRIPKIKGYNTSDDVRNTLRQLSVYDCKKEIFEYRISESSNLD